jgi:hypothetical protein
MREKITRGDRHLLLLRATNSFGYKLIVWFVAFLCVLRKKNENKN